MIDLLTLYMHRYAVQACKQALINFTGYCIAASSCIKEGSTPAKGWQFVVGPDETAERYHLPAEM